MTAQGSRDDSRGGHHERRPLPRCPGRRFTTSPGAIPPRRCSAGPRSSARSGSRSRPGSTTAGTCRSTSPRAASARRRSTSATARSRSSSTSSTTAWSFAPRAAPERGFALAPMAVASFYRRVISRARRRRRRGGDQRRAERGRRADPVPRGHAPRRLRRGRGQRVLARAGSRRPRLPSLPHRVPRQGEPGAFLLGQLRPRGDALLRPTGAAASRRHSRPARRGHARGLFARGEQRRLLARQRRLSAGRVLFVRLSDTDRLRAGRDRSARRGLVEGRWANGCCRTSWFAPRPTRNRSCCASCSRPIVPPHGSASWDPALECEPGVARRPRPVAAGRAKAAWRDSQ